MNRRPRRSGINFIENERDRNLTYFKRRSGLYKSAADLSTLTGAKVAIVVEAESGKKSAFGTPSANVVIDSFLSHRSPIDAPIDEAEMARITHLQDELFRLEKDKSVAEKRKKETKAHLKETLENAGAAKLLSDDEEELGADELTELFQKLTHVKEDINHQVKAQLEVSDQDDQSLPLSSSSWSSHITMPPRPLPWVTLQASLQHEQSPWVPEPQSSRPQPLVHPTIRPLEHAQSMQPLHHYQAHMMPSQPNETQQYDCYIPQAQPPILLPQVDLGQNYAYPNNDNFYPAAPPPPDQNQAYTQNFNFNPVAPPQVDQQTSANYFDADGQPCADYQWPPVSPFNEPYFDALCAHLGLADGNGGQADADDHEDMHDPSGDGLHQQPGDSDWLTINLWDSLFPGENSGGDAPGN